jgi:hypothetical protein
VDSPERHDVIHSKSQQQDGRQGKEWWVQPIEDFEPIYDRTIEHEARTDHAPLMNVSSVVARVGGRTNENAKHRQGSKVAVNEAG